MKGIIKQENEKLRRRKAAIWKEMRRREGVHDMKEVKGSLDKGRVIYFIPQYQYTGDNKSLINKNWCGQMNKTFPTYFANGCFLILTKVL